MDKDLPRSRSEAKKLGFVRYFTGKPCKHGHITERQTSNGVCVLCSSVIGKKWRAQNIDQIKHRYKEWRNKNLEKARESSRLWHANNREISLSNSRKWKIENCEKVKEYRKAYYEKHKDKQLFDRKIAYQKNRKRELKRMQKWRKQNIDRARQKDRRYRAQFPHVKSAQQAARKAAKIRRTPKWADLSAIALVYQNARKISLETGVAHHVDHIYPLKGNLVSGLHVVENLQIITAHENMSKSNKHPDDWPLIDAYMAQLARARQ